MDVQLEIDGVQKWYNLIAEDFEKRYEGVKGLYWDNFESKIVNELIDVKDKIVLDLGCGSRKQKGYIGVDYKKLEGVDIVCDIQEGLLSKNVAWKVILNRYRGNRLKMERVNCFLCGSSDYEQIIRGRDRLLGLHGEFTIVQCRSCGLRFTNPRPSINELGYYYPDNYGPFDAHLMKPDSQNGTLWKNLKAGLKQSSLGPFLKKISDSLFDSKVTFVPNLPEGAKVLELGCATGGFLNSLRTKGWELYGVEPAEAPATYARQELDLNIFCGTLEEASFPSNYFDAIFAWHVVEHLSNPMATMKEMNRILKSDGCLAFSIPNAGSWEFYLFRDRWYGLDLPRHLFHFTLTSIKNAIEKADFRVQKVFYQRNINNIVVSLSYCLEDIAGTNSVSNYLRTFPHSTNPLLKLFSMSIAIFLSVIRQGGRMTLVCCAKKV